MSNKGKILLAVIVAAFICLVVWVVKTTPDAPPPMKKLEPPTTMEYEGNVISEEINGVKIWELTADKTIVDLQAQNTTLNNLKGHFYKEDGSSIELTANYGTYDYTSKNVHIEGNVVVTTSQGAKLTSSKLDWISKDETLIASDKVRITRDDVVATGDMAKSNNGFKNFILKGNAHIIKGVKVDN